MEFKDIENIVKVVETALADRKQSADYWYKKAEKLEEEKKQLQKENDELKLALMNEEK